MHPLRDRLLVLFSSQELLGREWGWEGGMDGNCLLLANSFGSEAPWSSCLLKLWSISRGVFKVRM